MQPFSINTGSHGAYEWLVTERTLELEELLRLCPEIILGQAYRRDIMRQRSALRACVPLRFLPVREADRGFPRCMGGGIQAGGDAGGVANAFAVEQ